MSDPMRLARERTQEHFDAILAAENARQLDMLREAGPDVFSETDQGGAAFVRHTSGTVARVEAITHALECGDSAWVGQLLATLEHENNALRALVMMGDRFTATLRDRIEELESKVSVLGSPHYVR